MNIENEIDSFLNEDSGPKVQQGPKPIEAEIDAFLSEPAAPVLQVSLKEAANKNPDEYAKIVNLANKQKLPVDFTERNYQDLEKESRNHQSSYDQILKKTPAFASWLQDAKNAALVNDEIPQQQKIEEDIKEYGFLTETYNALGTGIARIGSDIAKIPALAYDVAAIPQNLLNKAIGRDVQVRSPEFLRDNVATQFYDKQAEGFAKEAPSLDNSITDEISKGNYLKAGRTLAIQFVANAPQQAAMLMGGIMGQAGKTLVAAGTVSAAGKNVENQEAGIDPTVATANALATGGLEAVFESVGTMGVLKSWEGVIAKNFGKGISSQVMKDFAKTMLYSMAAEGNEEALTSVAQDLTDYITGVNPDALTGIGQRALDAGFIGAASGGVMTGPSAIAGANARRAKEKSVKMAQDFYTNMGETIKNLKLKERSPEAQQQYLETATKGTQVENVYISTEAIERYFQGTKKTGEQTGEGPQETPDNTKTLKALQELGLIEKYEEAKRTGADMEIPYAEWAVKTSGDPIYNALVNDIKFNVDEPNAADIKADRDAEKQMLEAEAQAAEENDRIANVKALEQSGKAIKQDVEKQLRESGQSASQAKAQAQLYESTFRSLGERAGVDPLELFNRYNLSIGRAEVQALPVEGEEVLNQNPNVSYDPETGDYGTPGTVEANLSIRTDEMIEELAPGLSDVVGGEALEINTLEVNPEIQSKGMGSKALKDIENIARSEGQNFIVLKAEPLQSQLVGEADTAMLEPLIKFYEKNGFKIYERNETSAVMYKDLSEESLSQNTLKTDADVRPYFEAEDSEARYSQLPDTMGGKRIDPDAARSLDPQYASGKEGAILSQDATGWASSDFAQKLYETRVKKAEPGSIVQIFAGGSGGGKTTVQLQNKTAIDGADIIFDTTSASYDILKKRIDLALDNDLQIVLTHVYRPFNKAVEGVKSRFDVTGRIVPPNYLAITHVDSLDNVVRIAKEYKGDRRVSVEVFDNTKENPTPMTIEKLESLSYTKNQSREEAIAKLERNANGKLKSSLEEIGRIKSEAQAQQGRVGDSVRASRELQEDSQEISGANSDGTTLKQSAKQSASPTYSRVEQLITDKMGGSASPDQIKGMLRDMKPEEIKWLGIDEFLKGKKKISKEEMLEHIKANMVEVVDVTKGEGLPVELTKVVKIADTWRGTLPSGKNIFISDNNFSESEATEALKDKAASMPDYYNLDSISDNTKFSQYVLPGGENYREVLFTLPEKPDIDPKQNFTEEEINKYISEFETAIAPFSEAIRNGESNGRTDAVQMALDAGALLESDVGRMESINAQRFKEGSKPNPDNYNSSHWDEANVLAHVRLNDRTDADGKKVLFVEEIQSDWHQAGRKKGYKENISPDEKKALYSRRKEVNKEREDAFYDLMNAVSKEDNLGFDSAKEAALAVKNEESWKSNWEFVSEENLKQADAARIKYLSALSEQMQLDRKIDTADSAVPDAPFKKTWHEYAMKRIIRMAAEGGYDKVAWTTGEQQAERYDLSKQIDSIRYSKKSDGTYRLEIIGKSGESVGSHESTSENLDDYVGKEVAQKIIAGEGTKPKSGPDVRVLKDLDLKVGGEGMKGFYDNILVKSTDKLVKKFGGKVEQIRIDAEEKYYVSENSQGSYGVFNAQGGGIPTAIQGKAFETREEAQKFYETLSDGQTVHSLEITPQLRDEALNQGFSLFQDERGQIRFGKNGINIDLFKNADASTFLHETGHFYFKVLGDLAKGDSAPQQIKEDYDTLLKWMNVTDPENISVDAQEQFARGFEAYLLEGKAPTKELRSAFARFKVWLLDVYKSIRNLNVELSDDIRGVMDRLVATEEQIEIANQEIGRVPLFQDARAMGMSEAQAKKYTDLRLDAQESASEELAAKILKDFYKTKTKEYKARRKSVREEVEKEVSKYQPYVTLDQLRTGEQSSGMPMKLDRASVIELMGPEFLQKLPKPIVYTKKGEPGLHPDIAASYMGYESGDDMLTQLANLPPKSQVIQSLTDQRMKALYPDILKPEALPQMAMEAVHNDKQADVLMLELEMLAAADFKAFMKNVVSKTVKRLPTKKIVQEEADKIIGSRKITDIKPYIYKRAEIKSAKLAGEALAKGDIDAAFDYKRKELLNFELYNSATRVIEQIKKDKQLYKKLAKSDEDLAKTRDVDYINAARALLAEYGLGDTEKSPTEYLEKVKGYDPEQYQGLVGIINASMESDATNYEDMAYSDFRAMNDVVKALWDLSREAKTIEVDGKKETLNQAREDLGNRLDEISKPQESKKYTQKMSDVDKRNTTLLGARAKLRRFEHWVDSMDDGNISGVFRKYLYQPVSEATDKYILKRTEYIKRYKVEFDKLKVDPKKAIVSDELGHKFFNKYEILGALLHRGNNSNFEKLIVGRSWGSVNEAGQLDSARWDAFEKRMQDEGILTKEDYDFVQKVWDLMDELKPDAQKTNKKVFGFYFDEITANEFTNRFGTYKGGYAPAAIDTEIVSKIRNRQLRDQIINDQASYAQPYSGGKGFTKSRVNSNYPLALDLRIFTSHLDQALRFTYVKPAVMDASKILLQDEFKAKMDEFDPKIVEDMLLPALNRADKGTARQMGDATSSGLMRYANKFKTNSSMQLMFANIANTMQQVTGFSVAALKVSGLKLGSSTLNYAKRSKKMTQEIAEKSDFMRTRFDSQVFDIQRDMEAIMRNDTSTMDKMQDWALKHMYVAQSTAQNVMDAIIWEASYNESIEKNMTESQAVRKADADIRMTQSSFRPMDISASESYALFSLVQMFYSYFNTMLNVNAAEFEKLVRSDLGMKKKFQKGVIIYTLGYMIPAFVGDLVVQAMRGTLDEDEDEEITDDLLSTFFWSQLKFGTAMIPLVGAPIMAGINRANDKPWDDRTSMSPAFTGLTTIFGTAIDSGKALFGEDEVNAKRLTKDALSTIGLLSGLPVGAAGRPIGYLMDVEEGSKEPTGPIDFTRGLISGN